MAFLTQKKATAHTPQVVTLIVDDSGSMDGEKAKQATAAMQDLVIAMQSGDLGSSAFRFLLNIAKFGDETSALAVAATPKEVTLDMLNFTGDSGTTDMPKALEWAKESLQQALTRCRQNPNFKEDASPNPLVVFFSDGANTGGDVEGPAHALRSIAFQGGSVDVVACGIGMDPNALPVMKKISSRPDLAVNIDPDTLGEFIAGVGATVLAGEQPKKLVQNAVQA
jgi:uncharacterized protein YegL